MEHQMDLEDKQAFQATEDDAALAVHGLVELDPALFALVSGGLPHTVWDAPTAIVLPGASAS
jgi:hypothetical protein